MGLSLLILVIQSVAADKPAPAAPPQEEESEDIPYFPSEMINLKMPNQQTSQDVILNITHRFSGLLRSAPIEDANLLLDIKYIASPKVELEVSYADHQNEYDIGAGYHFLNSKIIQSQFNITFFDYKDLRFDKRSVNAFYQLSLNTKPIWKYITPVINAGYDGYYERYGYGYGLKYGITIQNSTIKTVDLIGEYYPIIDPKAGITEAKRAYCYGVSIDTFRHNFVLSVSNSTDIGIRRMMLGAPNKDRHFGFNILIKL